MVFLSVNNMIRFSTEAIEKTTFRTFRVIVFHTLPTSNPPFTVAFPFIITSFSFDTDVIFHLGLNLPA